MIKSNYPNGNFMWEIEVIISLGSGLLVGALKIRHYIYLRNVESFERASERFNKKNQIL